MLVIASQMDISLIFNYFYPRFYEINFTVRLAQCFE